MAPKIPPRKKKTPVAPQTADEFLDSGVSEEDSGDRWVNSGDIPKGVRFFQRAYRFYKRAIELVNEQQIRAGQSPEAAGIKVDTEIRNDAIYNICRMQFVVYTKVIKPGLLPEIRDSLEQEPPNDGVVVEEISGIAAAHEQAVLMAGGEQLCPIDLVYNYAQVLAEAGEHTHEMGASHDAVEVLKGASHLFDVVFGRQQTQLLELYSPPGPSSGQTTGQPTAVNPSEAIEQGKREKAEAQSEVPQPEADGMNYGPSALIDTLITHIHSLINYLAAVEDEEIDSAQEDMGQIVAKIDSHLSMMDGIISSYGDDLAPTQIAEAYIVAATAQAAKLLGQVKLAAEDSRASAQTPESGLLSPAQTIARVQAIWNSPQLPSTAERFMAQADSFIEASDVLKSIGAGTDAWKALSAAGTGLQEGLNTNPSNVDAANTCRLWVAKGDVEWMRRNLGPIEPIAKRNEATLLANSKVYYGNATKVQSLNVTMELKDLKEEARLKLGVLTGDIKPEDVKTCGRIGSRLEADIEGLLGGG